MPVLQTRDWGPIIEAALNRGPNESVSDVARRFGVGQSLLNRKLRASTSSTPSTDSSQPSNPSTSRIPSTPPPLPPPIVPEYVPPPPATVRAVVKLLGSVSATKFHESLEAQIVQFQQDIASDVAFARERFRTLVDSGDSRMAAVGVELWDRAIRHGRLNLGLPSEVIAQDTRNQRVLSISQASSTGRRL